MFTDTVRATQFRDKLKKYIEKVEGNNVLQIIHKSGPVRVMMTQEHYLNLISKIAAYEAIPNKGTAKEMDSPKEIARRISQNII